MNETSPEFDGFEELPEEGFANIDVNEAVANLANRQKGVELLLKMRSQAINSDSRLQARDPYPQYTHHYRMKFHGAGNPDYPFRHDAVSLRPKNKAGDILDTYAIVVRYGLKRGSSLDSLVPNNMVVITYFRESGIEEFFLSDLNYTYTRHRDDLIIEDLELKGSRSPLSQPFDFQEFESQLEDFEQHPETASFYKAS